MMEITSENYRDFCHKSFWEGLENVMWEGMEVPFETAKAVFLEVKKKYIPDVMNMALTLQQDGVRISRENAAKLSSKLEEEGNLMSQAEFARIFPLCGMAQMAVNGTEFTEAALRDMFSHAPKFRGRLPGVLPQMAAVCDRFGIDPELVFNKFNIQNYQRFSAIGLPKAEVIILATLLSPAEISAVGNNFEVASMVSSLLEESRGRGRIKNAYDAAAHFIAGHSTSDTELLRKVCKNPEKFDIKSETTIDGIKSMSTLSDAEKEVKKIEKAYKKPGFKLKDCKCLLKDKEITVGKYRAHILKGTDPRQTMLGYESMCCQHLGDAGETSMMYGLTNEHAGFWVLEDAKSGKLYAQGEVWEANGDTLVFDNIEFANDAELNQYLEPIGLYLVNSPYKNIAMGCGYNELVYGGAFKEAPNFTPSVTPHDIYVMSYEEDMWVADNKNEDEMCHIPSVEKAKEMLESGKATYYDYLYSDVDDNKGLVYLKENGRVAEYFGIKPEIQEEDPAKIRMAQYADRFKNLLTKQPKITEDIERS